MQNAPFQMFVIILHRSSGPLSSNVRKNVEDRTTRKNEDRREEQQEEEERQNQGQKEWKQR